MIPTDTRVKNRVSLRLDGLHGRETALERLWVGNLSINIWIIWRLLHCRRLGSSERFSMETGGVDLQDRSWIMMVGSCNLSLRDPIVFVLFCFVLFCYPILA
jgi:hypothetical protein